MSKNILIVTATHDFLWKFERDNVKILQQMGYTVHYAANLNEPAYLSDEEKFRQMGVLAHHIDVARSPFLFSENRKALQQLLWLVQKYHIQVIHCHTPVGGLLGRLAGRYCGGVKPLVIYTAHGFHFYKGAPLWNRVVYYQVERWLAHYTDILIVINGEDYQNARRFPLKQGGRVYKIPGVGLNRHIFHPLPLPERERLRRRLEIGEGEFFLVSVGELNENKNQRVVLEALARMKRRYPEPFPIRYGICGDGFFRERIEQWVREMGLSREVMLFGYCRDVPQILGCADAAVFPSKREGLGMAGLESLAMGIPVIASDNRGTREYMEVGRNGFVCQNDDVEGFIRSIESVRGLSREERAEMSVQCIRSVQPFEQMYTNRMMRHIYAEADRRTREGGGWYGDHQRNHGGIQPQ